MQELLLRSTHIFLIKIESQLFIYFCFLFERKRSKSNNEQPNSEKRVNSVE